MGEIAVVIVVIVVIISCVLVLRRVQHIFKGSPKIWYDAEYDMWFEGEFMGKKGE